eukprot:Hpha_TRINITY_DN32012_c0_g1::TRINITY_DN32012_c0_g1_i1::g.115893::m.115893
MEGGRMRGLFDADAGVFPCGPSRPEREAYGSRLAAHIRRFTWLHDAKQVDFIDECRFERLLPEDWRGPLLALSEGDIRRLPTDLPARPDWPPSLLGFVEDCRTLSM